MLIADIWLEVRGEGVNSVERHAKDVLAGGVVSSDPSKKLTGVTSESRCDTLLVLELPCYMILKSRFYVSCDSARIQVTL